MNIYSDDWDAESSKMASIYEDSYLTLAAALAPSNDDGFLGRNNDRLLFKSEPVQAFFGVRVRNIHDFRSLPVEDVLSTRAWSLQERLVSPRLLTFSLGVSLECREASWCECGSGRYPDPFLGSLQAWSQFDRREYMQALEIEVEAEKLYKYWMEGIVQLYSERKLSKQSDRLPAISALAQKFQMKLDDTYVAGIWSGDIIAGLSWVCRNTNLDASERGPSWSWVSVEGPLCNENRILKRSRKPNFRLQILEWSVTPMGLNTAGEVHDAFLRVEGPALTALLILEEQEEANNITLAYQFITEDGDLGKSSIRDGFFPDTSLVEADAVQADGDVIRTLQRSAISKQESVVGSVVCLMLFQTWTDGVGSFLRRDFLVLGRSVSKIGCYIRLGMLCLTYPQEGVDYGKWFDDLPEREYFLI